MRNLAMTSVSRVFLVGPMGTGKTTIGQQLSRALKFQFLDADHELEQRTGASISLIFDIEGEAGFREREAKLIDELTEVNELVLATGGGAVLREDNRRCLSERGFVIYLKSELETLIQRTRLDTTRPLLQTDDPAQTLRDILTTREPLYNQVADLVLDTSTMSVKQIVKRIISEIS